MPTVSQTITVNIPLSLVGPYNAVCTGTAEYAIQSEGEALVMVTLASYFDDIFKANEYPYTTRERNYVLSKLRDGRLDLTISCHGDGNDVNTLKGGGAASISVELTIRSTSNFTVEKIL